MKKLLALFIVLFLFSVALIAQVVDTLVTSGDPIVDLIPKSWFAYFGILLFVYEFIIRFYPTVKDYSIVQKVIDILSYLSKKGNNLKSRY